MFLYKHSFGPLQTNTILIGCKKTKKAVVIDPAFQSTETILREAKKLGLTIEKILLTHSHWDHFADAFEMKQQTRAPLFVHALDAANLESPGSDGIPLFIPIHPVQPDGFFADGDLISVGDLTLRALHTPGHSPGGSCFYLEKESLLISGDTLFCGGIGNLCLPTADEEEMRDSLQKIAMLPEDTRVIPGHGRDTTIGKEKGNLCH